MVDQQEYQRRLDAHFQRANGGDLDAQYALALITSKQNIDVSLQWLERAIAGGHPAATHTLGVWHIQGLLVPRDIEKGRGLSEKASDLKFSEADLMLAVLDVNGMGVEKSWENAISRVIEKGQAGHPRALGQLAMLCFMIADPKAVEEGHKVLEIAAKGYDLLAMYEYAKGVLDENPRGQDAEEAKSMMVLAATKGHHPGAMEYPGLENFGSPDLPPPANPDVSAVNWGTIKDLLKHLPVPQLKSRKVLKENPHIETFPGFLSRAETDYMIGIAAQNLARSNIVSPISGKLIEDEYRTSSDMRFWPAYQDLVIFCILERIADATGEPQENQEMLGVLRYEPGQEYKPHGDFFTAGLDGKNEEVERSGQRKTTFLVYLNDNYEGGETEFVNINLKAKGNKGDGLMFINVTETGEPNTLTVHSGNPVKSGLKWLSTMWIRERKYDPGY